MMTNTTLNDATGLQTRPVAIVVAGPPHSGKSVFSYHLNRILRGRTLDFYHLGATPDGEGHWSQEVSALERQTLRRKGEFTAEFAERMTSIVRGRQLPLLVDVGGRISEENEQIMQEATHAIILSSNAALSDDWQTFCQRCGLRIVARLDSDLHAEDLLVFCQSEQPIRAILGGLERGTHVEGPVLAAVAERVATLFLSIANPTVNAPERLLDLYELSASIKVGWQNGRPRWQPTDLTQAVANLPSGQPVALYNSAPLWAYVALLLAADSNAAWCYNARSGWHHISPHPTTTGVPAGVLSWTEVRYADAIRLKYERPQVVSRADSQALTVPEVPANVGVILDGRGPNWLIAALAASYPTAPWIAINAPQEGGAVVVRGNADYPLGTLYQY